jgi:predicted N-formylglutamate amidohydrolase
MNGNTSADWPAAVTILNEAGESDIVLLCEHASNHMPAEYDRLGLSPEDCERHIAWDIGAADLTRLLSTALDAPAFLSNYSRLLIDLNRPLHVPACIPARSEETDIPGNVGVPETEMDRRIRKMFDPYHVSVSEHIDAREREGRGTRIVSIHSFTPTFRGQDRPWHAGILHGDAAAFAQQVIASLRSGSDLLVDANVPYTVSPDDDYGLLVHGDQRGFPAILVEVRQDLLARDADIARWSERLAEALQ